MKRYRIYYIDKIANRLGSLGDIIYGNSEADALKKANLDRSDIKSISEIF